jgi:hypothetical protein
VGKGALVAGPLLLGFAGGFLGSMLARTSPTTPSDEPALSVDRSDFERLERRVAVLSARADVPAIPPTPAALAAAPTREEDEAPSDGPADARSADRLEAIEKRLTALESRGGGTNVPADLTRLPVDRLQTLVRSLTAERRSEDATRVVEELLRRSDLTPDQRVDAEMNIGYLLRNDGKHAEAEARFRDIRARVDDDSEKAPWLGFQIAWERSFQRDLRGAVAEMESAANHPRAEPLVRAHAVYAAANFARQAGETDRARALLERFLAQHAEALPPSQANMKAQVEAWLKEIRGH